MNEVWKDIPEYVGLYQVSNLGNVKSLGNGKSNNSKERILKLTPRNKRKKYLGVVLSKNSKEKTHLVHLLVWITFVGKIPEGYQINHIDENPENNRLDNLCLMTPKENMNWGTRNERAALALTNHPNKSKPVIQYDLEGNYIKEYPSASEVERQLGFNQGNISKCCNGKYKQMYGYIWRYGTRISL